MNAMIEYKKVVKWSNEDQCYVGSAPDLLYGGCHGNDAKTVLDELCTIVDEVVALYRVEGKPLPPASPSG